MFVRADLLAVLHARFKDELRVGRSLSSALNVLIRWLLRRLERIQERLDDMVAVDVRRELKDILIEFQNHLSAVGLHIFDVHSHGLNQSLHRTCPVHAKAYRSGLGDNGVHNQNQLIRLGDLNDLLAQIVAKLVGHRLCKCVLESVHQGWHEAGRHELLLLQLLLDHAAPCLVVSILFSLVDDVELALAQGPLLGLALRGCW